jgi:glutathione S-transferase
MYIIETRKAPNPRRVRIFLAEKGIEVDFEERDLMTGELKTQDFQRFNPWQRVPVLVLDDGRTLCETVAICRYFEELSPEPRLFGTSAFEKASIEMWQRRVELGLFNHLAQVVRHLNPKMAHLEVPQVPAWGEVNKPKIVEDLAALDAHLADSRYIAGEFYSIADITALVGVDFMKAARLAVSHEAKNLLRWHLEVSQRPSASA